jgi:hypothetical protein
MLRNLSFALFALLFVGCENAADSTKIEGSMSTFASDQIWEYKTRPHEEASRIIICRVESDPKLGEIVHIYVNGVRLKNGRAPGGYNEFIGHMPYSSDALRKFVTKLESSDAQLPPFEDGYREWRSAFDQGKAGVWTAPVSEAITGMEAALNQ